jgi:cytochrome c-type biogenesis protein CcmH
VTRPRTLAACLLAVLALIALAAAPLAAAAVQRTTLNDVENEVMCVVCGVPLNVAESPQADRERALIRRLIARGDTKEQVKQALVEQYGKNVLATPGDAGFRVTNWVVPAIVVVVLVGGALVLLPRWRRRTRGDGPAEGADLPELDADDARRLEEDLARYR